MSGATELQAYNSVLLLRSGPARRAIHVDEMLGNQEIVVKNIGPQLARVPGSPAPPCSATATIVLIINPVHLADRARRRPCRRTGLPQARSPPRPQAAPAVVMVVDDSLTVRKITSRLLEREGYHVLTAKDGVDALEQLQHAPDVILLDIEMPRMDGFDFTRNVRADPRTAASRSS